VSPAADRRARVEIFQVLGEQTFHCSPNHPTRQESTSRKIRGLTKSRSPFVSAVSLNHPTRWSPTVGLRENTLRHGSKPLRTNWERSASFLDAWRLNPQCRGAAVRPTLHPASAESPADFRRNGLLDSIGIGGRFHRSPHPTTGAHSPLTLDAVSVRAQWGGVATVPLSPRRRSTRSPSSQSRASGLTRFYLATGGGHGPGTINAIAALLTGLTTCFGALLAGAAAANRPEIPTLPVMGKSPQPLASPSNGFG
jgi:hypothetical protein